jgi:catechol 2,3-dioxygenase-like lactoylglutathione lyase family enzyme
MTGRKKVPFDMKLEVVMLGISDVDRAKAFYENLGWRLDIDISAGDFRGVQMTPHNSAASIIFGKGITSAKPGSAPSLVLAVDDIDAARKDLIARGVDVSEVFHYAAGPFNNAIREDEELSLVHQRAALSRLPPAARRPVHASLCGASGKERKLHYAEEENSNGGSAISHGRPADGSGG